MSASDGVEHGDRVSRTNDVVVDWPTPSRRDDAQGGARLSVWWAPLDVSATALEGFENCLAPEEWERAQAMGHERVRRRFVASRGWLRHLLGSELRCDPRDVPIVTDGLGKPRIASSDLSFSSSRTADVALYAVSWTMEVGVDIEVVRTTCDVEGIVARFMSPAERCALDALPGAQRQAAFFDCWTRKEAYGKAIGVGLGFAVRETALWRGSSASVTSSGWSVHQLDVARGFAAAVAGADTGNWAPRTPRRVLADNHNRSYIPLADRGRTAQATSRG